jgi:hypothetical protein
MHVFAHEFDRVSGVAFLELDHYTSRRIAFVHIQYSRESATVVDDDNIGKPKHGTIVQYKILYDSVVPSQSYNFYKIHLYIVEHAIFIMFALVNVFKNLPEPVGEIDKTSKT